ncbi:hypothetical protein HID58_058539 [Brassica napus]|uniref:Uncharacterized protein n=1 Tax=Brassica napus TaxID=3708 RepID=A0ABQ7ZR03_BRANA|nr:hypothetical protein HID58_058539 [Brassica napus]
MMKSSRRWHVTRRRRLIHLGSTSPCGGEIAGGAEGTLLAKRGGVATSQRRSLFHSGLVFGFRLRIQIVMAGRKRSPGRNAPSGVDTVVHRLNSNHKEPSIWF